MAQKCVHKGCGKVYTDEDEVCVYHPGPPIFHEGQKGWKCCKPRVLTFDEFLSIPPCTEGRHSTTDLPPEIEKKPGADLSPQPPAADPPPPKRAPVAVPANPPEEAPAPAPAPESDDDDPALEIPDGKACRRRACGVTYRRGQTRGKGEAERCVHHPGAPIFHEGSKGYTCCKRRVLEFDEFMRIEGCATKPRHLFVGSGKKQAVGAGAGAGAGGNPGGEEMLETVRHDFYQTASSVITSFFLKKINKDAAKVEFGDRALDLDLPTSDSPPKRYKAAVPLYAAIDPAASSYKILGTKLEVTLVKADGTSWPVLRSDERLTGEILQIGRAGRVQ